MRIFVLKENLMMNHAFASLLREMAFLGELKDENPFKLRAWVNTARIIEEDSRDLKELVDSGEYTKISGIGKGSQALIKEFVASEKLAEHDALRRDFPPTIFELTEVPGLGPKKAKALFKELGLASLSELEYACQENRLVELKGFGAKTQNSILANIQKMKANRGKAILPVALAQANNIKSELEELADRVEESGELRRLDEIISILDFVVSESALTALEKDGFEKKASGALERSRPDELLVRVWLAEPENFGSVLLTTTGPAEFLTKLGPIPAAATEEEIFSAKKIPFLPAECRAVGVAPNDLVTQEDIKGVFHLHTDWSDGKNTLEEMVKAAADQGWEYLGVSDHSQTAFYANGLKSDRVLKQKAEVARVQALFPSVKIFHGIESDILSDGSLDFPDEILKEFDFVIASVHGQMKMNHDDMTARLLKVLEHPATTWLGHWTGRLLLGREGFSFDQDAVMAAAQKHGKGIELNANPYRLDIDWRLLPEAARREIPVGIFPDAHSAGGLNDLSYGVIMARKAGLSKDQIINTKPREEMEEWLRKRKFR
jgi:DNA polymerase (family 10)